MSESEPRKGHKAECKIKGIQSHPTGEKKSRNKHERVKEGQLEKYTQYGPSLLWAIDIDQIRVDSAIRPQGWEKSLTIFPIARLDKVV